MSGHVLWPVSLGWRILPTDGLIFPQTRRLALLAGRNQTATTEMAYRHQIVPALTRGAEAMDQVFG